MHLAGNLSVLAEVQQNNKQQKVQPINDSVRKMCSSAPLLHHSSADEQMIPFCGNTCLKQHVKNKPHPAGIKHSVLFWYLTSYLSRWKMRPDE
jgi:hypothetical protein